MSTNSITTTHFFDNPNASALVGENTTKADAWRKAFDKEQDETLKDIRSVKSENAAATQASGENTDLHMPAAKPTLSAAEYSKGPATQSAQTDTTSRSAPTASPNNNAASSGQANILTAQRFIAASDQQNFLLRPAAPYAGYEAGETLSAIAVFESHFKQKWPLKNVHVMQTEKGIRIWIRDVNLSAEGSETQALIEHIKQAFKADNQSIAGLVLNGKTIL
jgi:hypothetical protein